MPEERTKGGELVLATGQFAHILDRTKGNVCVYVGPSKTSLSETDQPIKWVKESQEFKTCLMGEAICAFPSAPEGYYMVLTNPAKEKSTEHPKEGAANSLVSLDTGRKVNVRGPASFALWFQQSAEVVPGHLLRSNQYLVVQVYNEEAAKTNWSQAVIKRQQKQVEKTVTEGGNKPPEGTETPAIAPTTPTPPVTEVQVADKAPDDLSMGQRFIMKGTDLSFYIPPTGLEVMKDGAGNYVRDAVSLEQLEYCVLLNEDGVKRFVQGPAVVFPSPTETFLEISDQRKFKAIELNPHSGIYVKVTSPYKEGEKEYKIGEELFITGKTQAIYFPRTEHAIIKYADQMIHYAVAVPTGEGRYVLNRDTGEVSLVKGPTMLLPDPRNSVIVRRVLEKSQVELWYPNNTRAIQVNSELLEAARESGSASMGAVPTYSTSQLRSSRMADMGAVASDGFGRSASFTPPRTITLDNKYEGAVAVNVWNGYAVLIVSKTGKREVVQGPDTRLLSFDEVLMSTEFSTGTPKSAERPMKTVYLRVLNNRVSDLVTAETSDLVEVRIKLSYRVNFEGDSKKWFDVENYIQFMCDHTRSLIRNMVKKLGIQDFHKNGIDLIRDAVLGKVDEKEKARPGRSFKENGMRVYDVEVLDITIGDDEIASLMVGAQHNTVEQTLRLTRAKQDFAAVKEEQTLARERKKEESDTALLALALQKKTVSEETALEIARAEKIGKVQETQELAKLVLQETLDQIADAVNKRQKALTDQEVAILRQKQDVAIKAESAAADALVKKAQAFSPDLISALQAFSDKDLAARLAESMAPLAILRDKSVAEAFVEMAKGTGIEHVVGTILERLRPPAKT
ncbi:MAG: hypothetical protein WC827_04250 [Candidatus Paceibacterota bacterium]|jgi:major vault protein